MSTDCAVGVRKVALKNLYLLGISLTWPMAKLLTFWDYIFSRENKVQTFISGFYWLSEITRIHIPGGSKSNIR